MVLKPSIAVAYQPLVHVVFQVRNDGVEKIPKPTEKDGAKIVPKPTIPIADPVHVVVQVRNDEAHCWQLREIAWQLSQVRFCLARIVKRFPWIMFPRRPGLDVTDEAFVHGAERSSEVGGIKAVIVIIVHALRRTTEERKVIGLARMRDGEGVSE